MAHLNTYAGLKEHKVVSRGEWLAARKAFLAKEKQFTRMRDRLNAARRALPWVKVDKEYVFDGLRGEVTLPELFAGKRQLIVYHFMFAPGWVEGCAHCSFWADNFDGLGEHFRHRDTTMIAVSRAPIKSIKAFRKRMGWGFQWVSSSRNDFNYDFGVSFKPEEVRRNTAIYNYRKGRVGMTDREGVSTFYKDDDGNVYHTYSAYARGIDMLNTVYHYLDLTAKGRDEDPEFPQDWVRHHDKYG